MSRRCRSATEHRAISAVHVAEAAVDAQRDDPPSGPLAVGQKAWQQLKAEQLDARFGAEHPADVAAHRAPFHAQMLPAPHGKKRLEGQPLVDRVEGDAGLHNGRHPDQHGRGRRGQQTGPDQTYACEHPSSCSVERPGADAGLNQRGSPDQHGRGRRGQQTGPDHMRV
jgi:hypothetical protein